MELIAQIFVSAWNVDHFPAILRNDDVIGSTNYPVTAYSTSKNFNFLELLSLNLFFFVQFLTIAVQFLGISV